MKPCPYCAQTDTRKDRFGFCKKHDCFRASGKEEMLDKLKKEMWDARTLPTNKRNMFDGSYYNPRADQVRWITERTARELGFVPPELLDLN